MCQRLRAALPWDTERNEADLRQHLKDHGITLGRQQQQTVWDALAVAAYHAQTEVPVVPILLSDDAAAYDRVTTTHALCWVHEWRLYTKLHPQIPHHQGLLEPFRKDYWALYRRLLAYRTAPSEEERARLHDAFDTLIGEDTGYAALDDRMAMTADKRAELLAVLDHPKLPLHNNDMELGCVSARRRVRKRDASTSSAHRVSFGPQSRAGARAWDTFQTIAVTAAKLGVSMFHSIHGRLVSPETTPSLAERIAVRAGRAAQPAAQPAG
ncbi:MAG: hypothetical protein EI684_08275 [Candidatus Viridilinea halotolerans]|uniref:Transposase IS66 central domain-containing protein n=1 Tax=Candidatus Viridilinea halotolerans TaxID=2491704 RepID=A0A426U2F3_9CHLR|nr:MAG: hypothetical protein EI684_08275 [Candidatus Viridilinea halotolerans]